MEKGSEGTGAWPWVIFGTVVLLFLPALQVQYVFDDASILTWCDGHPGLLDALRTMLDHALLPAGVPVEGSAARPLTQATFEFQCWLSRGQLVPAMPGFNVVLHAVNAVLVFCWVHETVQATSDCQGADAGSAGALAAIWWGTHPLLATSVDYVVQRSNLTAVLGLLLLLWSAAVWLRGRASTLQAVVALTGWWISWRSKEWGVVAAPCVLVFALALAPRRISSRWVLPGVLVAAGAAALLLPLVWHRMMAAAGQHLTPWQLFALNARSQLRVLWLQIAGLVWPSLDRISVDHPWNLWSDGAGLLDVLGVVATVALCAMARAVLPKSAGWRLPAVGLGMVALAQLPYILSPGTEWWVDYKAYLLAPGLALVLGWVAVATRHHRGWVMGGLLLYCLACARLIGSIHERHCDAVALWTQAAEQPDARPRTMHNLAVALWKSGNYAAAEVQFRRTVSVRASARVWENFAAMLAEQNRYAPALNAALNALALEPSLSRSAVLVVRMRAELDQWGDARTAAEDGWRRAGAPAELGSWLVWLHALHGDERAAQATLVALERHPVDRNTAQTLLERNILSPTPCLKDSMVDMAAKGRLLLADLRFLAGDQGQAAIRLRALWESSPALRATLGYRLAILEASRGHVADALAWLDRAEAQCGATPPVTALRTRLVE